MSRDRAPARAVLLGAGAWARVLARAAKDLPELRIDGVWSRNVERLDAFAAESGVPARRSLDAIWADEAVDAVLIALPNDLHLEFARLAAERGKHVFIEKPIAQTLADGLRVAALEAQHGVRIVVGHCARLLAGNRILADAIAAGDLGPITQIEANFSNGRALDLTPGDWRWYQSGSPGGSLSQIAIHQFDVLRALGGDLKAVSARAARHSPVGAEVEDQWIVTVEFIDGKLGVVLSSWTSPGTYSVRVTGREALMYYEIDQARWSTAERLHEGAQLYRQRRQPGERESIPVPASNMFSDELRLFAAAIATGESGALSADNGCRALAAVEAALLSAGRGGAAVTLGEAFARARGAEGGER